MQYVLKKILGDNHALLQTKVKPGPKVLFTDLDVITLSITAAIEGYESENHLFSKLSKESFPGLLSRRQYNDRRRRLKDVIEQLCEVINKEMNESNQEIIVDSTPINICRYARASRIKVCKDNPDCLPNHGFCASQQEKFYGFRFHAVTSPNGVIQYYRITKGSEAERNIFPFITEKFSNCTLIADKGYLGASHEKYLYEEAKIILQTPYRKNQKGKPPEPVKYKAKRRIIETIFSNLKSQFRLTTNHAKNFNGFMARFVSKLCGFAITQYINKFITGRSLTKTKYALNKFQHT